MGLSRNDVNQLSSYLHFRTPRNPYSVSKYRKATAMNDTGFLDPITTDLPKGCWRLQSKKAGLDVSIKNLLWQGFEFKYEIGEVFDTFKSLWESQNSDLEYVKSSL